MFPIHPVIYVCLRRFFLSLVHRRFDRFVRDEEGVVSDF